MIKIFNIKNRFTAAIIFSFIIHIIIILPFVIKDRNLKNKNKNDQVTVRIVKYRELPSNAVISKKNRIEKSSSKNLSQSRGKSKIVTNSQNSDSKSQKQSLLKYEDIIKQKIEESRKYPYLSKKRREEGTIVIRFTLLKNGQYRDLKITNPAKYRALNIAALETIKNAGTFPPIPDIINANELNLELSIVFKLN